MIDIFEFFNFEYTFSNFNILLCFCIVFSVMFIFENQWNIDIDKTIL